MSADAAAATGAASPAGAADTGGEESVPIKRPAYEPAAGLLDAPTAPPSMPRPIATLAGAMLVLLRVAAGIGWLVSAILLWRDGQASDLILDGQSMSPDVKAVGIGVVLAVGGAFLAVEAVLAFGVLRGRNLSRVLLLALSTVSVATTFAGWWEEDQRITIGTTLLTLSLDILILLALSSRSSAAWARRPRPPRRRR